ncbi:MAG TPA: DEAD/DEAH box helicase, partial [Gemmataceae bacterium]|nr:DEAD/DEAH box helicase [Gemmataceae bacterium]
MPSDAPGVVDFLHVPPSAETALATLAEPLRRWFAQRFRGLTLGQRLAWPTIAAEHNFLLCAPTGSGKTLAAFVPILSRLLATPIASSVRCLYLTPLKALANDTLRNLRRHLRGIATFAPQETAALRVAQRTGDSSARSRRKLLLEPPDILLTTPESLAVLLTQRTANDLFGGLRWVVVDEVHAFAQCKRGADLTVSLERLEDLTGRPLQRIGLSATCAPVATAARFLVGPYRPCTVAEVAATAPLQVTVEPLSESAAGSRGFVARLVERLPPELEANRTTLIFSNTRSLTERLAWALRRRFPDWAERIAVHHSSLAPARRRVVERDLKRGRLRAVVSSTSLELGIDVGAVDGVVLVHPPGGVVRLLQRVGRAGHRPGRPRRGLVLTAGAAELLEAAVTGASCHAGQYEPLRVPRHPLDVLCQQLLGMAALRRWGADEAFDLVRRSLPYQDLERTDFDDCLAYLSGRDRQGRDWLPPRLQRDGTDFMIADERTAKLLRRNLGTILAEPTRSVCLVDGPPVGQVDEAFADRLQPGDRFLLDGRCLELKRQESGNLLVEEVVGRPAVPRWAGEGWPLSPELARRLYVLRVQAAEALLHGAPALAQLLERDYALHGPAAEALVAYFLQQEAVSEIPDAVTCLVECVRIGSAVEYYVHTDLNRAGNDALARVVVLRLTRDLGRGAASLVADLGFLVSTLGGPDLTADDWRKLRAATAFEPDLARALEDSLTFRERFRRVATTGLMLLRNPLGRRRRVGGPNWGEEQLF